jgi:regulator of sigma E protease
MYWLLMAFFISVLIMAHEYGHYWVARRCGVRVERFGLGLPMGKALWEKKIGETVFCIHPVLFGGYVSFPDDSEESTVPPDSKERFENQPLLNRSLIAIAGITVNALLAWGLMTALMVHSGAPLYQVQIGDFVPSFVEKPSVNASESAAFSKASHQQSGVWLPESQMFANGVESPWNLLLASQNYQVMAPKSSILLGTSSAPVELKSPPSAQGTLIPGDVVVKVDGIPVADQLERAPMFIKQRIKAHAGGQVALTVQPPGKNQESRQREVLLTPDAKGMVGIRMAPQEIGKMPMNLFQALGSSIQFLTNICIDNFVYLKDLVTGQLPVSLLSGPLGIVHQGGLIIEHSGIEKGLYITAMISMILAVMNLLPFPPLDGGMLLFFGIEALKGKPVSKQTQERLSSIGYFVMMGLTVFVLFNDIQNLFKFG